MAGNPVIAAWIAGGLIWSAALIGLGAMGGPNTAIDYSQGMARHTPTISAEDAAAAYERALDGDAWGDQDDALRGTRYHDAYRPASGPDS